MRNKLFLLLLALAARNLYGVTTITVDPNAPGADTALHNAIQNAGPGDTVQIFAGTMTVASQIQVSKGINIIGATQTCTNEAGCGALAAGTANDSSGGTVLNYTANNAMIQADVADGPTTQLRISGLTIQTTQPGANSRLMALAGTIKRVRLDHLHFKQSAFPTYLEVNGEVRGVMDHCIMDFSGAHIIEMYNGGDGGSEAQGHKSWATATGWGTSNFFFIEDSWFSNPSGAAGGATMINGQTGYRLVFRHNYVDGGRLHSHGTENQGQRGMRATEIYRNHFHWTTPSQALNSGSRNGNVMFWGNNFTGTTTKKDWTPDVYRLDASPGVNKMGWWGAGGESPWDLNDTVGGCTATSGGINCGGYVAGQPSYQYYPRPSPFPSPAPVAVAAFSSPSPTPSPSPSPTPTTYLTGHGTIVDNGANFQTGQWVGFSPVRESDSQMSRVTSVVGPTVLAVTLPPGAQTINSGLQWVAGDQYRIFHILVAIDQMGRGAGDLISGNPQSDTDTARKCLLVAGPNSGTQAWPREPLEPNYSWDNGGGKILVGSTPAILLKENRDYYNNVGETHNGTTQLTGVGVGPARPTNCITGPDDIGGTATWHPGVAFWDNDEPSQNNSSDVGALYRCEGSSPNATGSWVLYYQPYTYPHPCVTNWPTCSAADSAPIGILPSSATAISGQNASIDIDPNGGVPRPSLSPTATPGQTPAWANFTGGAGGSSGTALHISGTPTGTATVYPFSVKATNSAIPGGTVFPFTLTTGSPTATPTPPPTSPAPTAGSAVVGSATSITVTSTSSGPTPSVAPTASPGALPTWATFTNTAGQSVIGGTPTDTSGSPFRFSFVATNGGGSTISPFTLTVSATPTPTPTPGSPSPAQIIVKP